MNAAKITCEELKGMLDNGVELVIIDVRNATDYAASEVRLPGALRIPVGELEERAGEVDPEKLAVAYCT